MIQMSCDECGTIMPVKDALTAGWECSGVADGVATHICNECLINNQEAK